MKAILTLGLMCGLVALNAADDKDKKKFDVEKLVGNWKITEGKKMGNAIGDEGKRGMYVFTKDTLSIQEDGKEMFGMKFTIDSKASPATIDLEMTASIIDGMKGKKALGIIELDGDTLKLCYDPEGKKRPEKFADDKANSFTLKREKKEEKKDK